MRKAVSDQRWQVSIHEAGHVVAAMHLLGTVAPEARVFDVPGSVGGVTMDCSDSRVPKTFSGAVVVAAGVAAERLAWMAPAPLVIASKPICKLETIAPLEAARLSVSIPSIPTDEQTLAEWCVVIPSSRLRALDPYRWRQRLITVRWEARRFVNEHRTEILRVAERLYRESKVVFQNKDVCDE